MFWESKLAELQKLGTVKLEIDDPEGQPASWRVTLGTASFTGPTRARAVCDLWSHVIVAPFEIGDRLVRWNGRWEDMPKPEPKVPVVEDPEERAFDPAD